MEKICGLGIIGCGTFCDAYLSTLGPVYKNVRPVACTDLNLEAAKAAAQRYGVEKVCTTEELLNDPDVDIVLILTNPPSHYKLTMQALAADKHVYCEKPLATSLELVNEIVSFAEEKGLFVGAAPDTFLSSEFQTVKKLVDDGEVGKVVSVTANFVGPGADLWHPNAESLYRKGGGPVLDMVPYFLTALVSILGPVESVFCYANRALDKRLIRGQEYPVDVYTNYCGIMKFACGAVGNINMSFDVWKSSLPGLEFYGTDGVIFAPDPNIMAGPIQLLKAKDLVSAVEGEDSMFGKIEMLYSPKSLALFKEVETIAPRFGHQRGVGVSDMARAIIENGKPRVSAALCRHITEALNAFDVCMQTGLPYKMTTDCEIPAPLIK